MNLLLKSKILASGKSQLWLAREVGISEAHLSKIVGGWVRPQRNLEKRIAETLGCSVEEIFPTQGGEAKDEN